MHYNYHVLAAKMYCAEGAVWARRVAADRNPSRRRWRQRQVDRCRVNAEWHCNRVASGAFVPEDVAVLAKRAWRLRAAARKAGDADKRRRKLEQYRETMRAAGAALKAHLRDTPQSLPASAPIEQVAAP